MTRYLLLLDVFADEEDPDADVNAVIDILSDRFNVPHKLEVISKVTMTDEEGRETGLTGEDE